MKHIKAEISKVEFLNGMCHLIQDWFERGGEKVRLVTWEPSMEAYFVETESFRGSYKVVWNRGPQWLGLDPQNNEAVFLN